MIANKSNKAIVLIATIATLAVISVIVMFFAQSSMFERQIASNDNLERQAKLVATASIEWAASYIPKLAMGADDGDTNVKSKAYSSVADFYQFKVMSNANDVKGYDPHCPVEEHYLANKKIDYQGIPSFYYERKSNRDGDEDNTLTYEYSYRQNFDTNMIALPTKHNPQLDNKDSKGTPRWTVHSTLKCVDANAFWNINSPIAGESEKNYNTMVKTLLDVVLQDTSATSAWVKDRKDNKEFADLGDFRERMKKVTKLTQKQLDRLCRYITVDSWGNKKSFKYGKDYDHIEQDTDELWEKRYPININVASWEILATVFENIEADTDNHIAHAHITKDVARKLAKSIVEDRYKNSRDKNSSDYPPFKTWNDVEQYLHKKLSKDQAEAIFAVIYPGMLPHKKSPNRSQYRKFDKSDIKTGTTECCLFSPGVFYCEAIGRVIEYNKKPYTVLAHSKVSVNMKLWEPYIVNSQADFEKQRTSGNKFDAWSGIEGGITPRQKYTNYDNNVAVGYLHECQEEKEVKEDKPCRYWKWSGSTSKDEENEKEMRSDGLYFNKGGYLEDNYGILDLSSSNDWDEWDNTGFDLWIKPSYNSGDDQDAKVDVFNTNNTLPITMKVEESSVNSCYILTRCAYDKGVDYDENMKSYPDKKTYLTLSRTLCLKSTEHIDKDRNERDTSEYRVFYNDTIRKDVKKLKTENEPLLRLAGSSVYGTLLAHVDNHNHGFINQNEMMTGGPVVQFSEDFTNKIYNTVIEGKEEFFDINFQMNSIDIGNGYHPSYKTYHGILRVYLPENSINQQDETTKWCKVKIMHHDFLPGGKPTEFTVTARENGSQSNNTLYFYKYFFSTYEWNCYREDGQDINVDKYDKNWIDPQNGIKNQLYYGKISRKKNETKEAKEIAWFPGKGEEIENTPIQTKYKYSRTECRIPITLYKGRWYHIHARWEANKILIKEFDVSYKKMKSEEQEDSSNTIPGDRTKIYTEKGLIRKNFIGGPGRLWVNKQGQSSGDDFYYPAENETNKIYYYCPNCVIYYSNYRKPSDNNMKRWRYGSPGKTESIYNGNFNFEHMVKSFEAPKYFYYGTVAWTQFVPENKENGDARENGAVFNINGNNKFYSWGEEANYIGDLDHPNSIFMKKYANNMPFKFDLHDNNNEGDDSASHLETTIVDRVVLYMIVQPQPLHWSHNIYKDQKSE